uniref:Uncharacterized protein n=1 Tax=Zea mays TaxID=4577 RepID=A0A804R2T8_MAIZE
MLIMGINMETILQNLHQHPPERIQSVTYVLEDPQLLNGANAGSIPDNAQMLPRRRWRRSMADIDQDEPLNPKALADPDNNFYKINGVRLHHKVCSHEDEDSSSD